MEVKAENKAILETGINAYSTGSRAKLEGAAAIVIVTQRERIDAMSIPAAKRPKVKDIQDAVRIGFGGHSKEEDRGRYELCSLAFRLLAKTEKEHEAELMKHLKAATVAKLVDFWALQMGRATEDAARAWVSPGDKGKPEAKPAGEQVLAYLDKKADELRDSDLEAMAKWITEEMARRVRVAAALEEADTEKAA